MPNPHHYYLDTNFFIAALEGGDSDCAAFLRDAQDGLSLATTSALTLAELLVKPLARNADPIAAGYDAIFTHSRNLQIWPLDAATLRFAASICAGGALALPDAIHTASATKAGCDVFVSNDRHMRLPSHITQVTLAALANFTLEARAHL